MSERIEHVTFVCISLNRNKRAIEYGDFNINNDLQEPPASSFISPPTIIPTSQELTYEFINNASLKGVHCYVIEMVICIV